MNTPLHRLQVEQAISGAEGLANNLPVSELLNFRYAIPPVPEAIEICKWLKSTTASIEFTLNKLLNEIDLIREYRTRLVADVVTGQLDVRGVAIPEDDLTEYGESLEIIDDESESDEETESELLG